LDFVFIFIRFTLNMLNNVCLDLEYVACILYVSY